MTRSSSDPRSTGTASQPVLAGGPERAAFLDETLAAAPDLDTRLRLIAAEIEGRVAFSTSLGIEDQAVFAAIASAGLPFDVFTLDTGRHFPETYETLQATVERYGRSIRVVFPDAQDVEALVARDGIMGFRQAVENRIACCNVRKVRPLNKALAGAAGWITGLRREQSAGRAHVPFAEWDANLNLVKLNIIADWTLETLEHYVKNNAVPVSPLHAQGFPSIGCQPCTRAIRAGEDIRAGRWWWENEEGKECGLHNRPKVKESAA
ncbi:MAG: phosphoadenylyl-sulfate reductase [Deltaproteobacteria bacterium]